MGSERWHTIDDLFQAALACAPGERAAFLTRECGMDAPLRLEVESLIVHHGKAAEFLDFSLSQIAAEVLTEGRTPLADGQVIGHYIVIAPLGAGGMGEVYLAQDTRLLRKIALKILPPASAADPYRGLDLEQEARAASALNHPNIITVHEIGQSHDIRFIATEFVDGQTLGRRMASGRMTVQEALDVACQTASALAAAHEAGIVHRDIKPDNIMLRQDGLVKVLDFGLAKLIDRDVTFLPDQPTESPTGESRGVIMGTPQYMSPEQARGQEVDAPTDVFSLGVVLYEMIAGRHPFEGATTSEVITSILNRQPQPLSEIAPEAPAELEQLVSKALAKDTEGRYPSTRELLLDLRKVKHELDYRDRTEDAVSPAGQNISDLAAVPTRTRHHWRVAGVSLLSLLVWVAAFSHSGRDGASLEPVIPTTQRIAVLPFENLSGDPKQEYFTDGLTDDLIASLGQIKALSVISRTSVMRYKSSEKPLPEIAREINVRYLVEASAVNAGNRVRINVRLIDATTELPLWSESYRRDLDDMLALQDEIARIIARDVSVKLSPQEEARLARKRQVNPEAYDAYKMGQFHLNKRTAEGYQASIRYHEQAIARDPGFALAYAGLALTYNRLAYSVAGGLPVEEAVSRARSAAEEALRLDPMESQAHAALGLICYRHDYDWTGAEKEFRRALELDPNYSEGYMGYAGLLATLGRSSEAHQRFQSAYLLDPMSPNIVSNYAKSLATEGRFDEAILMHRRSIELSSPGQWNTYLWLGHTYERMGKYAEAIAVLQKALQISGGAVSARTVLGHAYALSGRRIEAEEILNGLNKKGDDPFMLAYLCVGLGRKDEAISWLEKLYEGDRAGLFLLKTQWAWDPLRPDPRFQDLIRRLGLPPDKIGR